MNKYSPTSEQRLSSCDIKIQDIFRAIQQEHTIICGIRSPSAQAEAYRTKKSKVQYPNSKHNQYPSKAIDAGPYPLDWEDEGAFYMFAGAVMEEARRQGVELRYGGDWDRDGDTEDQNFMDLVHFELV